ncbi:hypothetical protein [Bradyrhizobium sp. SZCCHNRI1003]|uniref:hypothetical protein n=1 Tax=Bradyrhizobium sp. SZCCHNRI1003 TaxID=3057275 RepID=UPI00291692D2|nr:hypothetical protein [Bradyrhizobium sp. SZCCHNRI1003]
MSKACDEITAALSLYEVCSETEQGTRITTHCLYPSFEPVSVFVVRFGDGFRVHDGGGAVRSAWTHGRDEAAVGRLLSRQAQKYQIKVSDDALVAEAPNAEWLASAILAVANASAATAHAALDRFVAATETALKDKILQVLKTKLPAAMIAVDYEVAGQSKRHRFDFAVKEFDGSMLLLNAVAPHHISISAKYVAFSDVIHRETAGIRVDRWAVHDKNLDAADISLLQQVADIVPMQALPRGLDRLMLQ